MNTKIKTFNWPSQDFEQWRTSAALQEQQQDVTKPVMDILSALRNRGDTELLQQISRYDGWTPANINDVIVTRERFEDVAAKVDKALIADFQLAANRIATFHQQDRPESWSYVDELGVKLGKKYSPVSSCMAYAPGGKAFYPSSVLMNLIPASIAGVERIILATPSHDGQLNELVALSALLGNADEIWLIGGASAVATATYGTETIKSVDMITGPGNIWFTTAKKIVYGQVGIDMIAGPSEIFIIADQYQQADMIAQDMLAQAEHDEQASSILVSDNAEFLEAVEKKIQQLMPGHPREHILQESIVNNSALIKVDNLSDGVLLSNLMAPEHVQISTLNANTLADSITQAGSLFIGSAVAEVLGDYVAGCNHVLPTSGNAKFSSPLGVGNFMKAMNIIGVDPAVGKSLDSLWQAAANIAHLEKLPSHGKSAQLRLSTAAKKDRNK